jgi:polyhydroxybutyrate depolymerase
VPFEAGDDIGFLLALLDELEQTLCVDTSREYASGMSNGAGMTMMLICEHDQRFAAAAPVAGVNLGTRCGAEHATPTMAFHGDRDQLVPYGGGTIFGYRLGLPTVEQRMTEMATLGGCDARPNTAEPLEGVRHFVWNCPQGMAAELYTVVGGRHVWPGAGSAPSPHVTDATKLILDFFDAQQRAG